MPWNEWTESPARHTFTDDKWYAGLGSEDAELLLISLLTQLGLNRVSCKVYVSNDLGALPEQYEPFDPAESLIELV
jgi:hypothetical protein